MLEQAIRNLHDLVLEREVVVGVLCQVRLRVCPHLLHDEVDALHRTTVVGNQGSAEGVVGMVREAPPSAHQDVRVVLEVVQRVEEQIEASKAHDKRGQLWAARRGITRDHLQHHEVELDVVRVALQEVDDVLHGMGGPVHDHRQLPVEDHIHAHQADAQRGCILIWRLDREGLRHRRVHGAEVPRGFLPGVAADVGGCIPALEHFANSINWATSHVRRQVA
mmetsp:Transcript_93883/g.218211  ORF Transcript_93883/g.218211 Transcript_93883/m.218211 type:complete len:221 (-) Transcript_93883:150-812(-)